MELVFLKKLMLMKQANKKIAIFIFIGIFYLNFNQMSATDAMIY